MEKEERIKAVGVGVVDGAARVWPWPIIAKAIVVDRAAAAVMVPS